MKILSPKDNYHILKKILHICFVIFYFAILAFLIRWQFFEFESFKSKAEERFQRKTVSSIRGDIIARNNETLAFSQPRWDVFAYLVDIEEAELPTKTRTRLQTREEFVDKVSTILGISKEELQANLSAGPLWVKIASKVDYETMQKLSKIPTDAKPDRYLVGLNFEFTSQRIYPENELASHVIGFLGKDYNSNDIGRGGIEQQFNGILEPYDGFVAGETDSFGNIIAISDSVSIRAKRGETVQLTIDKTVQEIVERKIREGVERYDALSGSVIVLDPQTGEILAIANYPTYNPNEYNNIENIQVLNNIAVTTPYEIGSVAKIFSLTGAIEEFGLKADEVIINGHQGCRFVQASDIEGDGKQICTADKMPMGPQTLSEAFINSDNLAFVDIGQKLGKEKLYKYLKAFGVGSLSGVDLSGESIGYLPALDNIYSWHGVDLAVFAYGHGFEMNTIQTASAVASIANDGWRLQPYVVSRILENQEVKTEYKPLPITKVASTQTCYTVKVIMEELFKRHTRKDYPSLVDYPVAAKSGTALMTSKDGQGYSSEVNATYIGFDTSENAKFVMVVKLEAPQTVEKLSYYSARPLWMETYSELKDYWGIKPRI